MRYYFIAAQEAANRAVKNWRLFAKARSEQRYELKNASLVAVSAPLVTLVLETASLVFRQAVRGEDSLFELGVDSLTVIEYCRRLEERLGVEVDLEELFAAENLASFGAVLAERVGSGKKQ